MSEGIENLLAVAAAVYFYLVSLTAVAWINRVTLLRRLIISLGQAMEDLEVDSLRINVEQSIATLEKQGGVDE